MFDCLGLLRCIESRIFPVHFFPAVNIILAHYWSSAERKLRLLRCGLEKFDNRLQCSRPFSYRFL